MDVNSVIDDLGGTGAVAAELRVPLSTVSTWRGRHFIPARRWPSIVHMARERSCGHITFDALAALCGPFRGSPHGTEL